MNDLLLLLHEKIGEKVIGSLIDCLFLLLTFGGVLPSLNLSDVGSS